jgi:hypothetical protein
MVLLAEPSFHLLSTSSPVAPSRRDPTALTRRRPRLTLSMHRTIHPCPSVRKPERTDDGPRPAEGETDRHRATPKQPRRPRGLKIQSSGTLNQTAAVPGHRRPPTAARAGKPKARRALDVIFREFPTASRKFDTTADRLLPRMTGADVPDRCPASEIARRPTRQTMNSGLHTESDLRRLRPSPTSHGSARESRRRRPLTDCDPRPRRPTALFRAPTRRPPRHSHPRPDTPTPRHDRRQTPPQG